MKMIRDALLLELRPGCLFVHKKREGVLRLPPLDCFMESFPPGAPLHDEKVHPVLEFL